MSIYDKSSLVLIPSGTKTGKVFSQKPVSGDGDFTFTRASAATRISANGNIEKETENKLLQSNSFDTTWTLTSASVTSGQSGYDGSSDAWLLTKSDTQGRVQQTISASGVQSFSVYAKKNASDFLRVFVNGSNSSIYFDLTDGSIQSSSSIIEAKTTNLGGDWYRCEVSFNGSTTKINVYPSESGSTSGTTGSIYIQDAQLEQGLVARDYIETTTTAVYGGITDNTPRLDYTDSSCPALLLEPQRTNAVSYSSYLGAWSASNAAQSFGVTSPEGVDNAYSYVTNSNTSSVSTGVVIPNDNNTHITSIFVKNVSGYSNIRLRSALIYGTSVATYSNFDLSSGTKIYSVQDGGIEDYGNGWYRIWNAVTNNTSGNTTLAFQLYLTNDSNQTNEMSVFGGQAELNCSYATSYIPTYGGSSVTRVGDDMDTTYSSAITTDGSATFFIELLGAPNTGNNSTGFNFGQEFASGDVISYNKSGGDFHRIRVGANYFPSTIKKDQPIKMAAVVTASSASVYANGVLVDTLSHTRDWSSATNLQTAITDAIGILPVKQYILFPTAITEQEAIDLTTI